LNEEIFYVSRENPAACACGRAFLCAWFWAERNTIGKKEGRRSCVKAFFVTFVCAARQGCLHHDMAYAWGMDCRPVALKLRQEGCLFTCNGGSEPFNRLLETNMVAVCWLMMLRTEAAK
jgi:hypothetical protein